MANFEGFPNPVENIPVINNNENEDIDPEDNIEERENKDTNNTSKESFVDKVKKGGRRAVVYGMLGLAGVGAIKGQASAEENFGKSDDPKTEKIENKFSTWMTATTGDYGPDEQSDIIRNLAESNILLSLDKEMIRSVELSEDKKFLKFVKITPKELGLSKGARYEDLLAAAKRQKLALVPAEGVFYLLLQNDIVDTSEAKRELITVAMNAVEYDQKYTKTDRKMDGSLYQERKETGKEMRNIFEIAVGKKDAPTTLIDSKAPKDNDLVNPNQPYLFIIGSASK